jgi:hypothetical protein
MTAKSTARGPSHPPYEIVISRLTIDKLGVKLYDKVSAVVAELVANGYDADAAIVTLKLPLGTQLADKKTGDLGFTIEVEDDGHGMTPAEAIDFYLKVGRDRREHKEQSAYSRKKRRPVMGRKGIGKLAPFGICRTIEVISAGGDKTAKGFLTTHFSMKFEDIVQDTDEKTLLTPGDRDNTYSPKSGTTIRLTRFLPKRVPDAVTFHRQVSRRFVFAQPDFDIIVADSRDPAANPPEKVKPFKIPLMDGTKVDVKNRPIVLDDGTKLQAKGWLGLAKEAYKDEEMAGVRIYARNKIVATTRDFEQPAGFTGEFTMRSYLVGEIYAEWLDEDTGEDLVRTDRQGILWDSDLGSALRQWGAALIKEIAAAGRQPRRMRVREQFIEKSKFEERARKRYSDSAIVKSAMELAEQIGGFAAEDELEDTDYVNELADIILAVAPHRALIEAFQEFAREAGLEDKIERLADLFGKTRIAEMASYGQIAAERVRVIDVLESAIHDTNSDEAVLQKIITEAPWLVHATWTVITINQSLKSFKSAFEAYWKKRTGETVALAITNETKRPDFTLVSVDGLLHIVEIKAADHAFDDNDMERLQNYVDAFEEFFKSHKEFNNEFHRGWQIDLVADDVKLTDKFKKQAYRRLEENEILVRSPWDDFLLRAKKSHEAFLDAASAVKKRSKK